MDHIPLCSDDWRHPSIEIPYLSDGKFRYDDQGFLTYPDRVGIDIATLEDNKLPTFDLTDAAPFLQSWLWFGLLGEALQVGSRHTTATKRLSSELFVKTIDNERYLSSRHLLNAISSAITSEGYSNYSDWHISRLSACIQTASHFIQKAIPIVSSSKRPIIDRKIIKNSSPVAQVLLACQVLCETIVRGFNILRYPWPLSATKIAWPLWNVSSLQLVNHLLQESGWYQHDIERLPHDVILRYHLSFYRPAVAHQSHQHEVKEGSEEFENCPVEPKHTHPGCQCRLVGALVSDIDTAARQGKAVLFTFRNTPGGSRGLEVRMVDLQNDRSSYVAISHVRSAGLGNGSANSLPLCQLSHIQSMVDQLSPVGSNDSGFFWLDTISLSTNRQLRKASLQLAWDIFSASSHVLVLDPPLYEHTFSSSEEALIRIRYSSWKSRLWTLEEGFVATNLVFRFKDRLISLDDLLEDLRQRTKQPLISLRLIQDREPWPLEACSRKLEDRELTRILKCFVNDILVWSESHPHSDSDIDFQQYDVNRQRLFHILRLGFLAGSKFRCLMEDDEYRDIPSMWNLLLDVYSGAECKDVNGQIGDIQHRLSRLSRG